jgi:hypothetical protein
MVAGDNAPLDLRAVFARPWSGAATVWRPWWLRWIPLLPTRFDFRTDVVADGDAVHVSDTQTFPDGKVWHRVMRGELVGPGRWRMTAPDMPGGAEITVDANGYTFTPYRIWAPVLGPVKVLLRCHDEVRFSDAESLVDTIQLRFLGVHVATVTMHLRCT